MFKGVVTTIRSVEASGRVRPHRPKPGWQCLAAATLPETVRDHSGRD
jgi:hypothetical protein